MAEDVGVGAAFPRAGFALFLAAGGVFILWATPWLSRDTA
jgi:hypothetical protein